MKTKENKRRNGSLFRFLAIHYTAFTAINLVLMAGLSLVLSAYLSYAAPVPDPWGFLEKLENTEEDRLSGLNAASYLGKDYGLLILDEEGTPILSEGQTGETPGREELECISVFSESSRLLMAEIPEDSRNGKYLLTRADFAQEDNLVITGYAILDENGRRLAGTLFQDRDGFTEKELEYLRGVDEQGRRIWRHDYTEPSGLRRQAVFWMREAERGAYLMASQMYDSMLCLFVLVYIATAAVCIYWLGRRMKRLLAPFHFAIAAMPGREPGLLENYRGPEEFVSMARSFIRMEERLEESEEERLKLDTEKKRLLADISHDLKTPVTVIRGYAAALKDGLISEEDADAILDVIIRKADQVGSLLEAFHEYSKLEHPQMPVHLQRADLCAKVREYFACHYQELEREGFLLEADIPETPIYCRLDRTLLERLLENLVNNAVKYNPAGTTIFVSVREEEKQAVLQFGDDGVGIPPELKSRLFLPFVTGDASRSGAHGSGLGLAACKRIAQLHGGNLELAGRPLEGRVTEFILTLPIGGPDQCTC